MVKVELIKEFDGFKIYPMCIDCEFTPVHQSPYDECSKEECPFIPIDGICEAPVNIKITGKTNECDCELCSPKIDDNIDTKMVNIMNKCFACEKDISEERLTKIYRPMGLDEKVGEMECPECAKFSDDEYIKKMDEKWNKKINDDVNKEFDNDINEEFDIENDVK